jgi:glycosyltransferase involved in cell wall biosynthesis
MCGMTHGSGTSGPSTNDSVSTSPDPLPPPSFAVVIPMYNEELGAERCVTAVCRELARVPNRCRLIAVDDGSADGTAAILERLTRAQPLLRVVTHPRNRGYGAALSSGVVACDEERFDYALFMDSDLTNAPGDIPRFAGKMAEDIDVVKGTRYSGGGRMDGVPWQRRWVSVVGGLVARALFRLPLSDCTNGFRAVKTRLRVQMRLHETGFPVIVEELYHCVFLARSFGEIPVVLGSRASDVRPTSFPYRPRTFFRYLKYCVLACLQIPPRDQATARPEPTTSGEA